MYQPTICFAPASIDACALWRHFLPSLHIPNSRFMFTEGNPDWNFLAESDVICVQRMFTPANIKFLQNVVAMGCKVIYDLDDDLWSIPKTNGAHVYFERPDIRQGLLHCMEWADAITVSTRQLKRVVDRRTSDLQNSKTGKQIPVVVCANRVDLRLFSPGKIAEDRKNKVVIGWGGSNTHGGDLAHIWPTLEKVLNKFPQAELELVGHSPPKSLGNNPRVRVKEWVHVSEYAARYATWNWDIVLAPLEDHKFNYSKSSIRLQEAGAIGKCVVASNVGPYSEFFENAENAELKWQLAKTDSAWQGKLETLIESQELRTRLGTEMRKHVFQHFDVRDSVKEWHHAINMAFRN